VAARYLSAGAKDDARDALRHNLSLWTSWSTLTAAVRAGHAVADAYAERSVDTWTVPFIAAMPKSAALRAPLVVAAVGTSGVGRLLEVGGGSGAYSIAFAKASPALRAEVFDQASVVGIAERHAAEAGVAGQVRARVGDLAKDELGSGYDLALLSSICHMLGPEQNQDLLRRVHAALAPKGRLLIQDFVLDESRTAPTHAALFAINMLVGTESGGTYTEAEYTTWLKTAGFADVRRVPLPGPTALLIASRP
jgi:precorrin-6B methylase 2